MNDEIILPDSTSAAYYVENIKGWVSRDGLFFGDNKASEHLARYSGCTHVLCDKCKNPTRKGWLLCDKCRGEKEMSRYRAMPKCAWDGKAMIYSMINENYYSSPDEAEDELGDGERLEDLRLVICEPNFVHLRPDYFDDVVPEDGECPDEILKAIETFNQSVSSVVVSWSPGDTALLI